ncbi:LLM class flavin-dependent oxidoreductase [Pseudomonas aeruginosa]|uniref:LLM class flavin-dependent oxidoreductase n=1 Tax=Pseudomonas TaxID=286 RepID=UPI001FFC48B2|nr:LLM class flavin-dependent oxidoreductase [Pseudomonas sp. PNPG3]MCK2119901.1 LLM class flavin-dependent oxidoreductase [Pseudomonas sp. PNPG3]HEP8866712.1 LLM class flavin-dependent oxidoreductase [Pseudomonas aeruginosa]
MTIDVFWRLPTHGEPSTHRNREPFRGDWFFGNGAPSGSGLSTRDDGFSYIDYLAEIARAAEISGFQGGLIPSFPMTDEPWAISAFLARETRTFRFMIAFQPGFLNPVTAARMTASLQRATNGRALFNVITGGGGPAQLWWGDSAGHDARYNRTDEFLDVLRGVWNGGPFSYDGRYYQVKDAGLALPLAEQAFPEIYFSGSSDAALATASKHAEYYLTWLEPFAQLREKFARVKERTDALGRKIKCAVRVDIVARATEEEAWREVRKGFERLSPAELARVGQRAGGDSVGASRQDSNRPQTINRFEDLIIEPNVWSGFNLLRGGQTNGIVGSYQQVAERLDELVQLGADAFILASTPHLEEAYRVGEEVLPLLRGQR